MLCVYCAAGRKIRRGFPNQPGLIGWSSSGRRVRPLLQIYGAPAVCLTPGLLHCGDQRRWLMDRQTARQCLRKHTTHINLFCWFLPITTIRSFSLALSILRSFLCFFSDCWCSGSVFFGSRGFSWASIEKRLNSSLG